MRSVSRKKKFIRETVIIPALAGTMWKKEEEYVILDADK